MLGDDASADGLTIGSSSAEARGIRGKGSYVPRTSMGLESRAVLSERELGDREEDGRTYRACATTMLYKGWWRLPKRDNRILTTILGGYKVRID